MGSMGISPKLSEAADAPNQQQIATNPETSVTQQTPQAALNLNHAAGSQVDRVEQLLAQLEAKSIALVPYGYWNAPHAVGKRSNNWVLAAVLGCLWLSSLALTVAYFSYRHSSEGAENNVNTTPLLISATSDQEDKRTAESVNQLTKVLVNSSSRLTQIEAVLQKSNLDLQQLKTKVGPEGTATITRQPEVPPVEMSTAAVTSTRTIEKANQNTAVTLVEPQDAESAPKPSLNAPVVSVPPSLPASPKTAYQVLSVRPTDTAIPHKAADGTIDYWLVAHGVFKELYKVQPIAIAAEGVVIHCLEDGKNYTLTHQGEWRTAEW